VETFIQAMALVLNINNNFRFPFLETNIRGSDEDVFASGQVSDLNLQLIQEQRLRLSLEERLRSMEAQLATAATVTTLPGQTVIKHVTPVRLLSRKSFVYFLREFNWFIRLGDR
jgi:hypothetical protein